MSEDVAVAEVPEVAENTTQDQVIEQKKGENSQEETSQEEVTEVEQEPKSIEDRLVELESESKGKQAKIDRQTAAYNDLQRAYQRLLKEKQGTVQQEVAAPVKPDINDFDDYNAYQKELDNYTKSYANYLADQKINERQKEFDLQKQKQAEAQILEKRHSLQAEQESEYMKVNPLYEKSKTETLSYIQFIEGKTPSETAGAVLDQIYEGNVAQIIDFFGKNNGENLDELGRISQLPPHKAAVEIYKIQQKLGTPEKRETKQPPKPITNVSATRTHKKLTNGSVLENLGLK